MGKINNLTGKKFGRLKVIKYYRSNKNGRALWLCQCDCGNTKIVLGNSLLSKLIFSCGCYNKEIIKNVIQNIICLIANYIKYGMG